MKLIVAYGRPGSGKTTKLKSLQGTYYDFDTPDKRKTVKKFIEDLPDGTHIIDFFLTDVNDFVEFFFKNHPIALLEIYEFDTPIEICLERDFGRRTKSSEELITKMVLEKISERENLTIYKGN